MIRLAQPLMTLTSRELVPAFSAEVMSTRNGCFHTMPSDLPFTETSARFLTLPRSNHTRVPGFSHEAGASIEFMYVAAPEKYFMPSSELSFQSLSFWKVAEGGAPR